MGERDRARRAGKQGGERLIFAVIAAMAFFAAMDLPQLVRKKKRRELIVYAAVFAFAFVYMLLYACGVRGISANEALHRFVGDRLGVGYRGVGL